MERRKITDSIVIHCSATPEGRDNTAADIRAWHKARGFEDIGYHYVIKLDGTVEAGRRDYLVGAHCREHGMNRRSVGICYVGGMSADMKYPKDTRTEEQKKSMKTLVDKLRNKYSIPADRVFGHRDFAPKACPSFDVHTIFITLLVVTLMTVSSCTRTVYVPVESVHSDLTVRADSAGKVLWRVDTVIDRDTVRMAFSGDTIYKEVARWRYRYREHTDTIYRDRKVYVEVCDSVSKSYSEVEHASESKHHKNTMKLLLLAVLVIICLIIFRRLRKVGQ